jgi:hypothetical protein
MRSVITTRLVDGTKAHNDDDDARVEGVRPPREGKGLASHVDKQPSPAQPTSNLSCCATCVWWPGRILNLPHSLWLGLSLSHISQALDDDDTGRHKV